MTKYSDWDGKMTHFHSDAFLVQLAIYSDYLHPCKRISVLGLFTNISREILDHF